MTTNISVAAAYTQWAPRYDSDQNLTRDLDRLVTANTLGERRFAFIVEAGCGTGKNTSLFARISDSVLALDFSPGMLTIAQRRVSATNVHFVQANLLEPWPCASGAAELVSCNLVLEHIEHIELVFREAARVLAVDGMFFVSELHPHKQYLGSQARFANADASGDNTETRIDAFTHHLSDFLRAANDSGLQLERVDEAWHDQDTGKPPRLMYFIFRKSR